MRKEKDPLGVVWVPENRYFGAQTQRALENFQVGSERFPQEFIQALALVKKAAARVHHRMGYLPAHLAQAIEQAADEVLAGKLAEDFSLVIWQSGSATQLHMNLNEVLANRAIEILGGQLDTQDPVHPHDHVNMSQSTNDTVPTAMHIAAVQYLCQKLLPAVQRLQQALAQKASEFQGLIKIGRTHLQDATPLTLGQEFSGYAAQLEQALAVLEQTLPALYELPLGGTAVGTGLNAPQDFDRQVVAQIAHLTGYPFQVARNKFALLAAHDALVHTSGALKTLAAALMKIANDIRWLASGPRCGLGELQLPVNEPGSSIMPGKINPTQCEMLTMIVCQVYGNDLTISMAGSQGNFELNVFKPVIIFNLLQSMQLLADGCQAFCSKLVTGLTACEERIAAHLANSLMLVTALNRHIGYDKAATVALKAWRESKSLKAAALELGYLTAAEFDRWVRPADMLGPYSPAPPQPQAEDHPAK